MKNETYPIVNIKEYSFRNCLKGERGYECFVLRKDKKIVEVLFHERLSSQKTRRKTAQEENPLTAYDREQNTLSALGFDSNTYDFVRTEGSSFLMRHYYNKSIEYAPNTSCVECHFYQNKKCFHLSKVMAFWSEDDIKDLETGRSCAKQLCPYFEFPHLFKILQIDKNRASYENTLVRISVKDDVDEVWVNSSWVEMKKAKFGTISFEDQ